MGMASPEAWASRQNLDDPKLHEAVAACARVVNNPCGNPAVAAAFAAGARIVNDPRVVARVFAYHRAQHPRPLASTVIRGPRNRGRARRGRHRARVTRGPPEDDDPHHDRRHDAVGRALIVGGRR